MSKFISTLGQAFSNLNRGFNFLTGGSLTPLNAVENMLNIFPEEVWKNKKYKFLLPCEDYGWILFKVYDNLMNGLKDSIPNEEERKKTIYSNITIIPKTVDKNEEDTFAKDILARWFNVFGLKDDIKILDTDFLSLENNMKFDVIIGNPPYQQNYGNTGGNSASAKSIYNLFIQKAIDMNPKYICMITPSRYMTKTAQGITDAWVDSILKCNHFRIFHDYENSNEIFSDVDIKGGVNYFLWDRDYNGDCEYYFHEAGVNEPIYRKGKLDSLNTGFVIRNPNSYSIINKIEAVEGKYYKENDTNFSGLVGTKDFFNNRVLLKSNWKGYNKEKTDEFHIKYYAIENQKRVIGWISDNQLPSKNASTKDLWKIIIPSSSGTGSDSGVVGKPIICEPNSVCSQTFLVIGYDPQKHNFTEDKCKNIVSYITTRFFRYLVSIKKKTQSGSRGVYQFVPLQDFNKPWTDKELYKKYGLTADDIKIIEKTVSPMA